MDDAAFKRQTNELFPRQAAKFSAYAPICVVFLSVVFTVARGDKFLLGILNAALIGLGLVAAIFALFAVLKVGKKGVLGYALVGLILNGLLAAMVVQSFILVRNIANRQQLELSPEEALESPPVFKDSETIYDRTLGYSFEIPEGFTPIAKAQSSIQYSFGRNTEGLPLLVFNIEHLNGIIPPEKIPFEILKSQNPFPAGTKFEEFEAKWQEFKLYGIRAELKSPSGMMTVYIVQIPISKQAIQLIVGGPTTNEDENLWYFEKILSSVRGKSNWTTLSGE